VAPNHTVYIIRITQNNSDHFVGNIRHGVIGCLSPAEIYALPEVIGTKRDR